MIHTVHKQIGLNKKFKNSAHQNILLSKLIYKLQNERHLHYIYTYVSYIYPEYIWSPEKGKKKIKKLSERIEQTIFKKECMWMTNKHMIRY